MKEQSRFLNGKNITDSVLGQKDTALQQVSSSDVTAFPEHILDVPSQSSDNRTFTDSRSGWRKDIEDVVKEAPTYPYHPSGNDFDPSWTILPPMGVKRISRPLKRPLELHDGKRDFVILPPKQLIRPTPLVIIDNTDPRMKLHGDLSRRKDVIAAGQVENEAYIDNHSGHYMPGAESLEVAEEIMKIYRLPFTKSSKKYFT